MSREKTGLNSSDNTFLVVVTYDEMLELFESFKCIANSSIFTILQKLMF